MVQTVIATTTNAVGLGVWPCEDGAAIKAVLEFNGTDDIELDLSAIQSQGHFSAAQTIYVNNVNNAGVVGIKCNLSDQEFQCPIGGFMYMPLLLPNPPKIRFSCTQAIDIVVHLINFFLPPVIWGPTLGGGGAGVVAPVTPNDFSGTIAVGGTFQVAIPANLLRAGFLISNPDTETDTLYIRLGAVGGSIPLLPGATYETGILDWLGDIFVTGATAGNAFTAYEGT